MNRKPVTANQWSVPVVHTRLTMVPALSSTRKRNAARKGRKNIYRLVDYPKSGQMKILVVDDDPHIFELTSAVLASGGYDVIEASTGKDALEAVARAHPDLVVLDVVLPDMSGFEVCKQIKSDPALRRTFVALHSGISTSSQAQTAGLDIGADGYIVKGIPANELLARVNSLVRIKKAEDALQRAHDELDQRVKERTAELLAANQRLVASEKSLLERLRFERLLSELSARVVYVVASARSTGKSGMR